MRYAPEHNKATRERILDVASRLFRERGIAGVGLAKIMAEADLTVGTFYTHFQSKEALVRETLLRSQESRNADLEQALSRGDFETVVRAYLSPAHRDAPGAGCPVAALVQEVTRHPHATRKVFASQIEPSLEVLARCLSEQRGQKVDQAEAAAVFGLLMGTLQLARATPNKSDSAAVLEAGVRAALRLAGNAEGDAPARRSKRERGSTRP